MTKKEPPMLEFRTVVAPNYFSYIKNILVTLYRKFDKTCNIN